MSTSTYHIKTEEFEGPFDLILFFIQRDELDIHDIPIAKITDDFLAYIRLLEEMDIDLASEFILVAATLVRIKSKMLLPRKELDEFGEEIDPRKDFMQQIIEYKRFKEVVGEFEVLEEIQMKRFGRGNAASELNTLAQKALVDAEMESISLFKLMETFHRLQKDFDLRGKRVVHKVYKYPYTSNGQMQFLKNKLGKSKKINFNDLVMGMQDRIEAIFTFLAILEMLNQKILRLTSGSGVNDFFIEKGKAYSES
ncbi:MAG: chromosome segregation protein ScpA [Saprospirales bacterium]|nr:MAG: chromosome segregation protein ScpA [Saprospirales bacterium]